MSKKDEAFELFNEGKGADSPEVKALKLKGNTKYNYFSDWQKAKGATPDSSSETKSKGKVISEREMLVSKEGGNETEPENEPEPPEDEPKDKTSSDGKKPLPTMVAGQSLPFAINISVKTLMLYQIAASMQEEELTLGDFVDVCVEDTYKVRGFDVGLIKTGGE